MTAAETFRSARDFLLAHREDYQAAYAGFRWPDSPEFNWAFDWFDTLAAEQPEAPALWIVGADGSETRVTYAEMANRSAQLADWLRAQVDVNRGDRILLLLGNRVELWETLLAAIRLGAVVIPATTLLAAADLRDRIARGHVRHVVAASLDAD